MQAIMESENQAGIQEMLKILCREEREACEKTQLVISDLARAFFNAWQAVFGDSARHSSCSWHLERAWDKNIKNPVLLAHLKELRVVTKTEEFFMLYEKLKAD